MEKGNPEARGRQADGLAKTPEEAVPFSTSTLCVRGWSLRFMYCEIWSSSGVVLEVISVREMTLQQCCLLLSFLFKNIKRL